MAFFDGEGRPADREMMGTHLRSCLDCQTIFEEIGQTVPFVDEALDLVHPLTSRSSNLTKAWMAAAAAAVMLAASGVAFHSAGQKAMAAIASLFQVNKVGTVAVSPTQLAKLSRIVTQGGKVTLSHYGTITVAGPLRTTHVPISQLPHYGMTSLWPSAWGTAPTASVQTGLSVRLKLNVPNINALISSQDGRYLFPQTLNQEPFTFSVPAAATMHHGQWTLEEAPRPSVAVPGRMPVAQVAKALENLPFLPPQLQSAVAQMANWKNTLIVPLPGHPQNVTVAGTQGIVDENASKTTAGEAWVQKNGMVVAVIEHQSHPINQQQFRQEVSRLFP